MACRIINRVAADSRDERDEVVADLLAKPATLSPKYFYDELGCALYGAICRLPEYYPTRTEAQLFREYRAEIAHAMDVGARRQHAGDIAGLALLLFRRDGAGRVDGAIPGFGDGAADNAETA